MVVGTRLTHGPSPERADCVAPTRHTEPDHTDYARCCRGTRSIFFRVSYREEVSTTGKYNMSFVEREVKALPDEPSHGPTTRWEKPQHGITIFRRLWVQEPRQSENVFAPNGPHHWWKSMLCRSREEFDFHCQKLYTGTDVPEVGISRFISSRLGVVSWRGVRRKQRTRCYIAVQRTWMDGWMSIT